MKKIILLLICGFIYCNLSAQSSIYIHGSKKGEIESDGDVYINGSKKARSKRMAMYTLMAVA